VAGKRHGIDPELDGAGLHDRCYIEGGQALIRDALRALVEDATEDRAFGNAGSLEPGLQGCDRAGDLASMR
jgi:hypothetical protein